VVQMSVVAEQVVESQLITFTLALMEMLVLYSHAIGPRQGHRITGNAKTLDLAHEIA